MHFELTNSTVKWFVLAGFLILLFCFFSALSMVIRQKKENKNHDKSNQESNL